MKRLDKLTDKIKLTILLISIIVFGISIGFITTSKKLKNIELCNNKVNCIDNEENNMTCNYYKDGIIQEETIICPK